MLLFFFSIQINSQSDSFKKIRFSGVQMELNGVSIHNVLSIPLSKFASINPTDSLVNKNYSGYGNNFGAGYNSSFNSTLPGRVFFRYPKNIS